MSDSEEEEGRFRRTWTTVQGWAARYFDPEEPESATWWFWGCLMDSVTFISMVQAATEPVWFVAADSERWTQASPHIALTPIEMALLYTGMACGIAKWMLIAMRATGRFVRVGSALATFFVFAQLVLTAVTYGMFQSELPLRQPANISMEPAEGYISAIITIVFASISLIFHLIDDWLGCPTNNVSMPKRDMILATLLAMTLYLIGGAIYSKLEGWKFHESFYYCIVFLTTIGYGHITARSQAGLIFSIFYGMLGILCTFNLLFAIRAVMIEWIELSIRPLVEEWVRKKKESKMAARNRRMSTSTVGPASIIGDSSCPLQRTTSIPLSRTWSIPVRAASFSERRGSVETGRRGSVDPEPHSAPGTELRERQHKRMNSASSTDRISNREGSLSSHRSAAAATDEPPDRPDGLQEQPSFSSEADNGQRPGGLQWASLPAPRREEGRRDMDSFSLYSTLAGSGPFGTGLSVTRTISMGGRSVKSLNPGLEMQRRRSIWMMEAGDTFKEEEQIQRESARLILENHPLTAKTVWTDRWIAIWMGLFCVAYLVIGAAIFFALEPDWSYLESFWFCFVTISTTGFGDYSPTSPRSWQFWTYYSLLSIAVWAYMLTVLGNLLHSRTGSLIEFNHKDFPS